MHKNYLELSDFNHNIYKNYKDLELMTNEDLENHYLSYGIAEGRVCNTIKNRKDFVNQVKNLGKILEIGPLDNPQFDHTSPDYYSLDVFDKAQLIKNYIHDPNVIKDNIVEPSYVIVNNDYSPIKQQFERIFSSHNIEHMPCIVTFLNNLDKLLGKEGEIYLIVPDKRYCFDHFKRESDIYDVVQSFYDKNLRPKFTAVLKHFSQSTHNDCVAHWNNDHGTINSDEILLQNFQSLLTKYNTGVYIDAHVSYFTPESFIKLVELLNDLKLINLKIHNLYFTLRGSNEFYVILKKG